MDNLIYLSDYQQLRDAATEALTEQEELNTKKDQILGSLLLDIHSICELYQGVDNLITDQEVEMIMAMVISQRRDGIFPQVDPY